MPSPGEIFSLAVFHLLRWAESWRGRRCVLYGRGAEGYWLTKRSLYVAISHVPPFFPLHCGECCPTGTRQAEESPVCYSPKTCHTHLNEGWRFKVVVFINGCSGADGGRNGPPAAATRRWHVPGHVAVWSEPTPALSVSHSSPLFFSPLTEEVVPILKGAPGPAPWPPARQKKKRAGGCTLCILNFCTWIFF